MHFKFTKIFSDHFLSLLPPYVSGCSAAGRKLWPSLSLKNGLRYDGTQCLYLSHSFVLSLWLCLLNYFIFARSIFTHSYLSFQLLAIKSPSLVHNGSSMPYNVPKNRYGNINCCEQAIPFLFPTCSLTALLTAHCFLFSLFLLSLFFSCPLSFYLTLFRWWDQSVSVTCW